MVLSPCPSERPPRRAPSGRRARRLGACAVALLQIVVGAAQAREDRLDRRLLAHRTLNGKTIAEVLSIVQVGRVHGFQVQGADEFAPADDGRRRAAICYWLGDVRHVREEAACDIRFILDERADTWAADPATANLSTPLLVGETAFDLALDIRYKDVCGADPERSKRSC